MKIQNFCLIDLETTGVNFDTNGVIQIAGSICKYHEDRSFALCENFNFKVRPFPGDVLDSKALEVNKTSIKEILAYPDATEVYKKFTSVLGKYVSKYNKQDKFQFLGYNASFDFQFLRKWFEKCGDKYFGSWFFFPPLDVMNFAAFLLLFEREKLLNFKLETVANYLKISAKGDFHDATKDITVTREMFIQFNNQLK